MATLNVTTPEIERAFIDTEAYWQRALDLEFEKGSAAEREDRRHRATERQAQPAFRVEG